MINITKEELKHLNSIGSGCFGTAYKKDDKVYKVYNEKVQDDFKNLVNNPMLKNKCFVISKLNILKRLNKKLLYTDLLDDILYIDNKFSGIVMPYYEGDLFLDLRDKSIEDRIKYSKELIRNARELTDNFIYPLDHRLRNIMLVNNEVKLIDLDDYYTRVSIVSNPIYFNKSIESLDESIKAFFNEYSRSYCPKEIKERINKPKYKENKSYQEIENYIDKKRIKNRLVFVDGDFNDYDNNLINNSLVILICDKYDIKGVLNTINKLNERGIIVYDVVGLNEIDACINDNAHTECLKVEKNKILTLR